MKSFELLGLESRTLLSGSPVKLEVNLDVDRSAITAAITKFKSSVESARVNVTAASAVQKQHIAEAAAKVKALTVELTKDTAAAKSIDVSGAANLKVLQAKWSAVIGPEELDVKVATEGESEQERAADVAKLTAHRDAAKAELAKLQATMRSAKESVTKELANDRLAIASANKSAAAQLATDAKSLAASVTALRTVYQSGKLVVDGLVSVFKKLGGKMEGLPALPKL